MLVALLMAAPLAQAGTMDDPEIADDGGDSTVHDYGLDIDAVWIEHQEDEADPLLRFLVHSNGDPQHVAAFFALHQDLRIGFTTDAMPSGVAEYYVSIRPSCPTEPAVVTNAPDCTQESVSCNLGRAAAEGGYEDVSTETALTSLFPDGSTFGCVVPYSLLTTFEPGHSISDLYLLHRLIVRGPLAGGDEVGPEPVETFDRAPDDGVGRVFTTPAAAPDVIYQNITQFPFQNESSEPVTGLYHYNWTGSGPFVYSADVQEGSFLLNVSVQGQTLFTWNGSGAAPTDDVDMVCVDEQIAPEECTYAFRYALDDFVGSYGIDLAPQEAEGNATSGDDGNSTAHDPTGEGAGNGTVDGNQTVDGGADEKESPAVGWVAPLAVAAAVAVLRRRKS